MTPSKDTIKDPNVEFNEALKSFYDSNGNDLSYKELLRKNPNLRKYFESLVFEYTYDHEFNKLDLLFKHDETLFKITELTDGTNTENLLQSLINICEDDAIPIIEKYFDKFEMNDELKNKLISDSLFLDEDNLENNPEACDKIIDVLIRNGVKISSNDLVNCWQKEIFKKLVENAEPSILQSFPRIIIENDLNENDIDKIKCLLEIDKVNIDDFLDWNFWDTEIKNNFVTLVFNHGNEATKTSFMQQISNSNPKQKKEFFNGLSEDNRSLISTKINKKPEDLENITKELQPAPIDQKQLISQDSSDSRIGDKKLRENGQKLDEDPSDKERPSKIPSTSPIIPENIVQESSALAKINIERVAHHT